MNKSLMGGATREKVEAAHTAMMDVQVMIDADNKATALKSTLGAPVPTLPPTLPMFC